MINFLELVEEMSENMISRLEGIKSQLHPCKQFTGEQPIVSSPLSFLKSSKTVLDIPQNAHAQSLK
jgi:hypothetical protein